MVTSFSDSRFATVARTVWNNSDQTSSLTREHYHRSVFGVLLGLFIAIYFVQVARQRSKGKLPPGPMGLPLLGNLLQLSLDAWLPFTEWKYKYGPLVYITAGGQGILVLSSHKVAADLLDRKAHIYNGRPRFIVASEYLTGGMFLGLLQHNDVWKRMRRAGNEVLNKAMAPAFYPAQEQEAVRAASSLVLSVIYDLPILRSANDPAIERINRFVSRLTQAMYPGTYLVEFFTWMKYLPSAVAQWKRDAITWYRSDTELFVKLYKDVEDRMNQSGARPSFTSTIIRDQKHYNLSPIEGAWLSANMYAGGAETSATVVDWFMLAMIAYPEIQAKCHQELDAVIGRSRMPGFADQESLPYIRATVREVLRWRTVVPIGAPHQSMEDDWYEGYFIPKGTIVIANIWAMNRDKEVYGPDADTFNPGRYIGPDGNLAPSPPDTKRTHTVTTEGNVSFGYGGRICPGRHVANASLFINIACLLWAANISPEKDAQGQPIMPDLSDASSVNDGIVVRPLPFKCSVTARFPEATEVLDYTKEMLGM
uniref:Putative cytochrome P450 n=1 Tax=Moniliophthora roreri TaxID=221103 RepID=A0A0W0FZK7_MONRR